MLVNGKNCDLISIRDRGVLYGDGVFRTMLVSQGHAMHWPLHYRKLQGDCAVLGMKCPDFALLSNELEELLTKHPHGVLKLVITRGPGKRGYAPSNFDDPTRIWDAVSLPDYPADCAIGGVKVRWCQIRLSHQPRLAGIKHLNRLENVLAAAESDNEGIGEGLLMDMTGNVIEGIRSNVFLVSQGGLITPDLSNCGVAGVQRERVMALALEYGMPVQVRHIIPDEVMNADEVFLVNSIIGLWPVRELGQHRWADFPVAMQFQKYLNQTDHK